MSAYTTIRAIKRRFPQFTEEQWGQGSLPSNTELEAIIATASDTVDDECRPAYIVPFEDQEGYETPSQIGRLTLALCVAEVRELLFNLSPTPDQRGDTGAKAALAQLEKIGKGGPPTLEWPRQTDQELSPGGVLYNMPGEGERVIEGDMEW